MRVKYFAPKVTVKLCINDFSSRDNSGQNKEQSECLLCLRSRFKSVVITIKCVTSHIWIAVLDTSFYACHFLAVLDQWFPLVSTTNNTVSHNKTKIWS